MQVRIAGFFFFRPVSSRINNFSGLSLTIFDGAKAVNIGGVPLALDF